MMMNRSHDFEMTGNDSNAGKGCVYLDLGVPGKKVDDDTDDDKSSSSLT